MADTSKREELLESLLPAGGAVLRNKNGGEIAPVIALCRTGCLGDILALQEKVRENVRDKDTFVLTTREEFLESLELDFCIGAFVNGRLIAFTLMVSNRSGPRNIGCAGGGVPAEAAGGVTYDTTFVDPGYAGYGLQRFFVTLKDQLALALGAGRAYATVSPSNTTSLKNMLESGFEIVGEKSMYGGYARYVLCKRLTGEAAGDTGGQI